MPKFASVLAVSLFSAFLVLGPGCEKGGSDSGAPPVGPAEKAGAAAHTVPAGAKPKIAFVSNNASDFWNIARKGIEKAQKELKIQVDFKAPQPESIQGQVRILEDLESQGYNGIAISVLHSSDMNSTLNRLSKKLNLITHDSDAPESGRIAYIGTNNFQAGEMLGREVAKLFPKSVKMAFFVGTISADNARQRRDGVLKALTDANITVDVVALKEDNKDMTKAVTNVEDVLNAHADVQLLVGLWAYNPPAIAKAVKNAGKKEIKIVGFDEYDETLQAIKDGGIACTIAQKPFEFGYQSSKLLHELCTKGAAAVPQDPIIDTGVTVVVSANVDEFWNHLKELKK